MFFYYFIFTCTKDDNVYHIKLILQKMGISSTKFGDDEQEEEDEEGDEEDKDDDDEEKDEEVDEEDKDDDEQEEEEEEEDVTDTRGIIQIFVVILDKSKIMSINIASSIRNLITMIERKTGNNSNDLNITYGGKPLNRWMNLTLQELGIMNGSVIMTTQRLRGGMSNDKTSEIKTPDSKIQDETKITNISQGKIRGESIDDQRRDLEPVNPSAQQTKMKEWKELHRKFNKVSDIFNRRVNQNQRSNRGFVELDGNIIHKCLQKIFGEEVYIIHPDLNSVNSMFDPNDKISEEGVNDFLMQLLDIKAEMIQESLKEAIINNPEFIKQIIAVKEEKRVPKRRLCKIRTILQALTGYISRFYQLNSKDYWETANILFHMKEYSCSIL